MGKNKIVPTTIYDDDKFDFSRVGSANDCTGLIMVPPQDDDQMESYMNLYDFGPPYVEDCKPEKK